MERRGLREVFHVATARGQATLDVSRQLGSLAVFDTWEGQTAKPGNTKTRRSAKILMPMATRRLQWVEPPTKPRRHRKRAG
ncbi:hypothetical protein I553_9274 [Mycobacterium xenopi 4042]|uniref:Uncharacterized protein n=1 Tax=Mycobacterium xenopi 4042 TaxID=1299334 RepID=X7ZNY1_MYCXE|nr:hypothetical protein I553_9274 [Mycobacterium xenopi 4042]